MDATPFPEQDEEPRYGHLRAAPRDSMFLMATLRRHGQPDATVKVRNLSTGGMMAEVSVIFRRGEMVEVDLRGIGAVGGTIAWAASGRIGVQFDSEVDPVLARKPVGGGPQPQLVKAAKSMWRPGLR